MVEKGAGPLIGAGAHQIGQEIAGLKRERVIARSSLAREFRPEEDNGDVAWTQAPPVSEKRKEQGGTDSDGRLLGHGPFLAMGRMVSRGLLLLFFFFSLFFF
jgi:hypothetical protein